MSTCISRAGEYSAHETTEGNYICDRCGVLDEEGLFAERDDLRAKVEAGLALADWFEAQPNWREWGVHAQIRTALAGPVKRGSLQRESDESRWSSDALASFEAVMLHRPVDYDAARGLARAVDKQQEGRE